MNTPYPQLDNFQIKCNFLLKHFLHVLLKGHFKAKLNFIYFLVKWIYELLRSLDRWFFNCFNILWLTWSLQIKITLLLFHCVNQINSYLNYELRNTSLILIITRVVTVEFSNFKNNFRIQTQKNWKKMFSGKKFLLKCNWALF